MILQTASVHTGKDKDGHLSCVDLPLCAAQGLAQLQPLAQPQPQRQPLALALRLPLSLALRQPLTLTVRTTLLSDP